MTMIFTQCNFFQHIFSTSSQSKTEMFLITAKTISEPLGTIDSTHKNLRKFPKCSCCGGWEL